LNKYKPADTSIIKGLYKKTKDDISRFLNEDFLCALNIISWLLKTSETVGDTGAKQQLSKLVCDKFTAIIFSKIEHTIKRSSWAQIKSTEFAKDAACDISNMEIIRKNESNLKTFTPAEIAGFTEIYLEAVSLTGEQQKQNLESIIKFAIKVCSNGNDADSLHKIVSSLSQIKTINTQNFLFSLVKGVEKADEFVIKYIIDRDANIIISDDSVRSFSEKLKGAGLEKLADLALVKRVNVLNKPSEIEKFIKGLQDLNFIGEDAMAKVYESIDAKVSASDNELAEFIQAKRPGNARCVNSAHLFALSVLSDNRKKQNLIEVFTNLSKQGFPSITAVTDEKYLNKFVELLLKTSLTEEEQLFIINILSRKPEEYFSEYSYKLTREAAKHRDKWNALFKYAFEGKNEQIKECIVQAIVKSGQSEKFLVTLGDLLEDKNIFEYYKDIADRALKIMIDQKGKSGIIGKLFG